MKANFSKSLKPVLVWEGGYVNHPKDPGGPTNKGITQRVYDAYRSNNGKKPQSVAKISSAEVEAIYKEQYWDVVKGDDLPAGVDLAVFDYAVNSGTRRAAQALQKCVGVEQDGQIGQITLQRVTETDELALITSICNERLSFVKKLSTWSTFGIGWQRRIMGDKPGVQEGDRGIIDIASRMAKSEPLPPLPKNEAGGKADSADRKLSGDTQVVATGVTTIGGGGFSLTNTIVTGLTDLAQWAGLIKDQVQPLVDYSPYLKGIFVTLAIAGVVGGLAAWLKKRHDGALG